MAAVRGRVIRVTLPRASTRRVL